MERGHSKIKKEIKKYGLEPASQRELPLFTLSCIALGYTNLLRKKIGISYKALAAVGGKGKFHTLLNEEYIALETEKFVKNNLKNLDEKLFSPADLIYRNSKKIFIKTKEGVDDPFESLKMIVYDYPDYMGGLGMYNCLWRYSATEDIKKTLSSLLIKKISEKRECFAELYPQIEELIKKLVFLIGKNNGFDGDLLRYFTSSEIKKYLKTRNISRDMLQDLKKRREKYFYLFIESGEKEYIITDKNIINKLHNDSFKTDKKITEIKGYAAYGGLARGIVYNFQTSKSKPPKDFILVVSMTHPKDIALIKKCRAIVTDEGGILSHAAIVSRELKKPCVIGAKIATKVLRDGDLVEVDADKGVVRIVKR